MLSLTGKRLGKRPLNQAPQQVHMDHQWHRQISRTCNIEH